jgi:hypothetical protein
MDVSRSHSIYGGDSLESFVAMVEKPATKANFDAGIRICEATATVCTCCSMVSHMTYAIFVSTCCDASAQCMHSEYGYDVLLYEEVMLVALNATY